MTVLAILASLAVAGAAVSLGAGARRHDATTARGYRWLAGSAVFWCAGLVMQIVIAGSSLSSSGAPLSLADVAPLLALGACAVGITTLGAAARRAPAVSVLPGLADGYVTAVSLLVIGWVVAFGSEYHASSGGPGTFLLDLLHPLADLAVLGALLPTLAIAWRRTLLPYLALLAVAGADSLGVGARISGGHQGVLEQLAMIAAGILLGASPWAAVIAGRLARSAWPGTGPEALPAALTTRPAAAGRDAVDVMDAGAVGGGGAAATIIAALAVACAAFAVIIDGLASAPASGLALPIAGGAAVLVVAVRVLMLVRDNGLAVRMWRRSGTSVRELADRTSDMVLICDLDGTISYASPTAAGFSYPPGELAGKSLGQFIHPEDIPAARAVIASALDLGEEADPLAGWPADDAAPGAGADGAQLPPAGAARGRLSCRVRAADGTWRPLECAVLPYQVPGERDRMLLAARDASEQVALRAQVAHLTFHDGLTGLPNRAYLEDRARAALGAAAGAGGADDPAGCSGPVAGSALPGDSAAAGVIFLDLDGFTGVNDTVGHGAGDVVLAQASRRLRAAVPGDGTVARWGGDEFAILLEQPAVAREVTELAERLAEAIGAEPFTVSERDVALTASIGVALAGPGEQAEVLLRNADMAMSHAKASGGNQVAAYEQRMHAELARRLELAGELKRAIERDELSLAYQPVVELATSRVAGLEALARWRRGNGEDVEPREFLSVAEESGQGGALAEWILRTACEQGAAWRAAGWSLVTGVNVSARQLASPKLAAEVAQVLASSGLPPAALAVEVSERAIIEGGSRVASRLAELRDLGVRLAIDDFGTGYASLATLRELPVDMIKVDPSFTAGLGSDPTLELLTQTITRVGRDLGIEVIAEGIEQPRQLAALREMGCPLGQGYLLARPADADAIGAMLARSAPPRPRAQDGVSKAGAA